MKKYGCKPRDRYFEFIFLFDNDLTESQKIKEFIEQNNHKVIQLNSNLEGFILGLIGKKISFPVKDKLHRDKCKAIFKNEFGLEADKLKSTDWNKIFGKNGESIHELSAKHEIFKQIVNLIC